MRLTGEPGADRVDHSPSSPAAAVAAAGLVVAGLLIVFAFDRATESAPVQHLYYLPIVYAAIRFGARGGLLAAAAAVVLYHLANPLLLSFRYEQLDLLEVVLFLTVAVVSARMASDARRLRALASTDDLTGLQNLRAFEPGLRELVRRARYAGVPLSVLVLDLDRLKALNDEHGHLAGAEAVRTVGRIISRHLPPGGIACRYGGDEFAAALPARSRAEATRVADELCRAVHEASPVLAGIPFPVGTLSISVGIAHRRFDTPLAEADETIAENLFRAADSALYAAKRSGRNQVSVA